MGILERVLSYYFKGTSDSMRFYPHGTRLGGYQLPPSRITAVRRLVKIDFVFLNLASFLGLYLSSQNFPFFLIYMAGLFVFHSAVMELIARLTCHGAPERLSPSDLDNELNSPDTVPIYEFKTFKLLEILAGIILIYNILFLLYQGNTKGTITSLILFALLILLHFAVRKVGRR